MCALDIYNRNYIAVSVLEQYLIARDYISRVNSGCLLSVPRNIVL